MSTIPGTTSAEQIEPPSGAQTAGGADTLTLARRLTWLTFALCLVVTGAVAVYEFAGLPSAALVGSAGLLAVIGWQAAETKRIRVPAAFIALYLLLAMSLLVQHAEEFAFRGAGTGTWFSVSGFAVYSIGAAALFMLGASALSVRHPLGAWAAWLVCIWAVLQSLAHYLYPLFASGRYVYIPGQALAWIPLLIGLYGLLRLMSPASRLFRKGGDRHD
ncbi:hypothetical protein QWJ34_16395 [Saccharibacillus sp. CPCC 101409]|uniref:hypothetical protein n=1 Tax=Saccharibacillus sp. CPCC 101409 TaxID=3058041 RepID=UPI0026713A25|nr:hypothetical protein [Saccharibacillus sp. CPCC 101409]MDO3411347.1 hypothetical protein [Saccharibacillus sp. CPCC 101409]